MSKVEIESWALELLEDWRNGNRSDFREKVGRLKPLAAMYCGLLIIDYMQSVDSDLERELFITQVYPD